MSSTIQLSVPDELRLALFFSENHVTIDVAELKEWKEWGSCQSFLYDLAYYHRMAGYHPWEYVEKHVAFLSNEWKKVNAECQKLFSERKTKQALEPMKEGIALFFTMIYWIHNQPVQLADWEQKVNQLAIKPVNAVERFAFIVQRPALYHSFIQLSELFTELEKHYVKSRIKKSPR